MLNVRWRATSRTDEAHNEKSGWLTMMIKRVVVVSFFASRHHHRTLLNLCCVVYVRRTFRLSSLVDSLISMTDYLLVFFLFDKKKSFVIFFVFFAFRRSISFSFVTALNKKISIILPFVDSHFKELFYL